MRVENVVTGILIAVGSGVFAVASATLIWAIVVLATSRGARAHDWYPTACCSGNSSGGDCGPVDGVRLWTLPNGSGYVLDGKFLIGHDRVQWSPDGRYHACLIPNGGGVRCFFAPLPRGM